MEDMNIYNDIEKIADLLIESSTNEITLRMNGKRLTLRRSPKRLSTALVPVQKNEMVESRHEYTVETTPLIKAPSIAWIMAPMVGVFYHAEPPVVPGAVVRSDQVIGGIESMKLLNEVKSEVEGVVVQMAVEAGMAVEYGQKLYGIKVDDAGE